MSTLIQLENVHKSLGGKPILQGVNLAVEKGETMVIVGSSGTGKSVTLKHMIGLMRPDEGRVMIGDQNISVLRGQALDTLRRRFGVLFQSGALIAWMTVAENVGFPLIENTDLDQEEIDRRVREKLELVELTGSEEKRPSAISGGMKKRAALARALIGEPEILLYDEPTSGLDPVMSRHVDHLIADMQQRFGVTSVVVTHDLHSAFTIGDRVAMLHQGRVAEVASPRDFVNSSHPFVKAFVRAQFTVGKVEGMDLS